jgi:glycosyltransferase involved in cell wall biosynthesis
LVDQIGLTSDVQFLGHLDNRDKHEKMAQAHMLLMTSVREGWGLVVSEGNALGTPAVAYNVPGLRDSVVHEKTGLLTETSPTALASAMIRLWRDPKLYDRLVREGSRVVTNLSFDRAAELIRSELIRATGSAGSPLVGTASDSNRWTAE